MTDVFDVDALEAEEKREPFRFRLGGEEYELPHVADLTLRQQMDVDRGAIADVARQVAGDATADALLDALSRKVAAVQAAWLAHAMHKPGESAASSS